MSDILGVLVSKLSKNQLLYEIAEKSQSNSRLSLYFLYSEFVLRANRLPAYKEVLNVGTWTAVDGRGLMWSIWSLKGTNFIALGYVKFLDFTLYLEKFIPKNLEKFFTFWFEFCRILLFLTLFCLNLILNLLIGFVTVVGKHKFQNRTKTETILGRDFVWDLLQIAQDKKLKVAVVGGSVEGDQMTKHLISHLFPNINLVTWVKPRSSNLINDIPKDADSVGFFANFFPWILLKNIFELVWHKLRPNSKFLAFNTDRDTLENLNANNICEFYPDLYDAKDFLRQEKCDFVLLCLGGGSGKQEFFAQTIKQDLSIDFGLVTGLGAAIDYLGGEKLQPPKWVCQMGLEWVFRLIHQPYRRLRILDDILTLWWWTSLQQFLDYLDFRPTVVVQVENNDGELLMVKRRSILPGDVGWTFVQGGIDKGETPLEAAKREVFEETGLEIENLTEISVEIDFAQEVYPVSLFRTLLLGAKHQGADMTKVKLKYTGYNVIPQTNWENLKADWIAPHRVLDYLSSEKKVYFV